MMAGIREKLVPSALELGWVPLERQPGRKGETRFGEFEFERLGTNRIERMGFDFQYGDKPDVSLCIAVWTGDEGGCTLFRSGYCANFSPRRNAFWLSMLKKLRRAPSSQESRAEALAHGLRRLKIVEEYFREDVEHPDLRMTRILPPYQWPDGYADRIK